MLTKVAVYKVVKTSDCKSTCSEEHPNISISVGSLPPRCDENGKSESLFLPNSVEITLKTDKISGDMPMA